MLLNFSCWDNSHSHLVIFIILIMRYIYIWVTAFTILLSVVNIGFDVVLKFLPWVAIIRSSFSVFKCPLYNHDYVIHLYLSFLLNFSWNFFLYLTFQLSDATFLFFVCFVTVCGCCCYYYHYHEFCSCIYMFMPVS